MIGVARASAGLDVERVQREAVADRDRAARSRSDAPRRPTPRAVPPLECGRRSAEPEFSQRRVSARRTRFRRAPPDRENPSASRRPHRERLPPAVALRARARGTTARRRDRSDTTPSRADARLRCQPGCPRRARPTLRSALPRQGRSTAAESPSRSSAAALSPRRRLRSRERRARSRCVKGGEQRVGGAPPVADRVLLVLAQRGEAASRRRVEKQRVVAESAAAGFRLQDVAADVAADQRAALARARSGPARRRTARCGETGGTAAQLREQRCAPLGPSDPGSRRSAPSERPAARAARPPRARCRQQAHPPRSPLLAASPPALAP